MWYVLLCLIIVNSYIAHITVYRHVRTTLRCSIIIKVFLHTFLQDLAGLIAPATIPFIEAPTVRLEATVQNLLAESVPADALSLEQLALMLEALELKSAGGKKHSASASAGRSMC